MWVCVHLPTRTTIKRSTYRLRCGRSVHVLCIPYHTIPYHTMMHERRLATRRTHRLAGCPNVVSYLAMHRYDIILTSETIYSLAALETLYELLRRCIKPNGEWRSRPSVSVSCICVHACTFIHVLMWVAIGFFGGCLRVSAKPVHMCIGVATRPGRECRVYLHLHGFMSGL